MTHREQRRRVVNVTMFTITGLCAVATASVLLFILGFLVYNGAKSLNPQFFTNLPAAPGEMGGGMGNAILGSAQVVLTSLLIGVPIGLLTGVYLAEWGSGSLPFVIRYCTDLLNGVPSIITGIFAYAVAVVTVGHFSVFAGGVALSIVFIPVAVRTTEQFLRAVPDNLREGALALGATKWRTTANVIAPAAMRGIATGILLGMARAAGETAPLLFTSFNNRYWNWSELQPSATLPVMIYNYAVSPYADWRRQAWAGALVLLACVLGVNICARLILSTRQFDR